MDAFNEQPTTTAESTGTEQTTTSYLAQLVASKGDNWSDPETLAKGKIEADSYIEQLKLENEQLKTNAHQQDYAKEVLDALQKKETTGTESVSGESKTQTQQDDTTNQPLSEDALKSLVDATITDREQKVTASTNIQSVNDALAKTYGDKSPDVVAAKAAELGLTVKRLQEMAAESPSAFFALVPVKTEEGKATTFQSTATSVRTTETPSNTGERDAAYYKDLRQKSPTKWRSPAVQSQFLADRMRLGDKF